MTYRSLNYELVSLSFFKVSCEALGVPRPTIRWFKDGQEIRDSVLPTRMGDRTGKSSLELRVMGTADNGIYTCLAENRLGSVTHNYTLTVKQMPGSLQHAIVMEAGPGNRTVFEGDEARLRCKVKSVAQPHIKWLKKLDNNNDMINKNFINNYDQKVVSVRNSDMGNEQFRVMNSSPDMRINEGVYLNELILSKTSKEDNGMYICFVTNSGFGALTYKATYLKVLPRLPTKTHDISISSSSRPAASPDNVLLYIIISIIVVTFTTGMIIVICLIKRNQTLPKNSNPQSNNNHNIRGVDEDLIQQRPFLLAGELKQHDLSHGPASLPHLGQTSSLFTTSTPSYNMGQWSRTVYPIMNSGNGRVCKNNGSVGSSTHYENPHSTPNTLLSPSSNQYEVPYSHLRNPVAPSFAGAKSSSGTSNASLNPLLQSQQKYPFVGSTFRYPPVGGPVVNGQQPQTTRQPQPSQSAEDFQSQTAEMFPFRNYQYFPYLKGFEA